MYIFVILNWNKASMTINSIRNIQNMEGKETPIIVVDNDSSEDEREKLISFFRENNWSVIDEDENLEVCTRNILVLAKENYGYAKGNNIGLKLAKKLGYNWAVIMNNDVLFEQPIMAKLFNLAQSDNRIAVIGPRIIGPNSERQGPFIKPGLHTYFLLPVFYPVLYPFLKVGTIIRTKMISRKLIYYPYRIMGCLMLVNLEVMEEVGWFDEGTFLYAEEPILSEKLFKKGYKVAYVDSLYVRHMHGATTSELGSKKDLLRLDSDLYYFEKYRKYGSFRLFLVRIGFLYSLFVLTPVLIWIKKSIKLVFKRFLPRTRPSVSGEVKG